MADIEKKWYVLKTVSGKEHKVKDYIDLNVKNRKIEHLVSQVLIPTEKYMATTNNKRVIKERNLLVGGYVLVECALDPDIQHMLRFTPNVLGFLSEERGSNKPMPLRPNEINRLLGATQENEMSVHYEFKIGDSVKVADGPFNGFNGVIEDIIEEKKKLKVAVKFFSRIMPLELSFDQVSKE